MPDQGFELDVLQDLLSEAADVERLAKGEKTFETAYEAFRSADRKAFQTAIGRARTLRPLRADLPLDPHQGVRASSASGSAARRRGEPSKIDPRRLAGGDRPDHLRREAPRSSSAAIEKQDPAAFQRLIKAQRLGRTATSSATGCASCRFRLICRWVCDASSSRKRPDLALELRQAGSAVGRCSRKAAFARPSRRRTHGDAEKLRGVIHGAGLDLPLLLHLLSGSAAGAASSSACCCAARSRSSRSTSTDEAFEFAKAIGACGAAGALETLSAARRRDPKAFAAVVSELELGRFCIQLCHWICSCTATASAVACARRCYSPGSPRSATSTSTPTSTRPRV